MFGMNLVTVGSFYNYLSVFQNATIFYINLNERGKIEDYCHFTQTANSRDKMWAKSAAENILNFSYGSICMISQIIWVIFIFSLRLIMGVPINLSKRFMPN